MSKRYENWNDETRDERDWRGDAPGHPWSTPRGHYGRGSRSDYGPRDEYSSRGPHRGGPGHGDHGSHDTDRGRYSGRGDFPGFGGMAGFFGPDGPFGSNGPFGPNGPFGTNGPFGPGGPFGDDGPFGPGRRRGQGSGHYRRDFADEAMQDRPRRHGARGGRGPRARRGEVRLAVLGLLAEGDMNGYQMIRALEERTGGAWRPSPGAIYPALSQLEDEELITPADGGGKVFTLTDTGRTAVAELGDRARPWEGMQADTTHEATHDIGGTAELWVALGQLGLAVRAVGQAGDADVTRAAVELMEESRRGLYRLLAEDRDPEETDTDGTDSDGPQDVLPGDAQHVVEGEIVDEGPHRPR